MSSKVPKGVLSRSIELLKLAAKVGSEELLTASDTTAKQIEQAKHMVDSLGRLKGAAMKVGQLLSMDFSDLFPVEVRRVLEQLQSSSPHFMPETEIHEILRRELPAHFQEIENLSPEPIAAASIGQVHAATWRGKPIVLKIQYPGVAGSIDSDVAMLKGVVQSLLALSRKKMDIEPLFNELRVVFKNETNYILERENLEAYRANMLAHADAYLCPQVYPELSAERVLAMSFEEGRSLKEWIQRNPSVARKEKLGLRILDLYAFEFFEHGFVQSDPNPGNFLVRDDDRIVLLDFGAMKKFSREFIADYTELMCAVHRKDLPATIFQGAKMGFVSAKESEPTKHLFFEMLRSSLCAFDSDKQPFDFKDKEYFENSKAASASFGKASEFSPPPYEIIFLHRKLLGIFGILRDLHVKIDLSPYWKRVTSAVESA